MRGAEQRRVARAGPDQGIAFGRDVGGCEYFYSLGTLRDSDGAWFQDKLGPHPGRRPVQRGIQVLGGKSPGAMQNQRGLHDRVLWQPDHPELWR